MKTPQNEQTNDLEFLLEDILADFGLKSFPKRTTQEWVKALESRLERQRQEFASLLDRAAEKPELMKYCREMRQEIEITKRDLANYQSIQNCLN